MLDPSATHLGRGGQARPSLIGGAVTSLKKVIGGGGGQSETLPHTLAIGLKTSTTTSAAGQSERLPLTAAICSARLMAAAGQLDAVLAVLATTAPVDTAALGAFEVAPAALETVPLDVSEAVGVFDTLAAVAATEAPAPTAAGAFDTLPATLTVGRFRCSVTGGASETESAVAPRPPAMLTLGTSVVELATDTTGALQVTFAAGQLLEAPAALTTG